MVKFRIEHDSMGEVQVPEDAYWGAQTQRSFQNFKIGRERMPIQLIHAFAILKKAAATTNYQLGRLDEQRKDIICQVCDEIVTGHLDQEFPLAVWQTGSGTQTNMNVNEVIANRGNIIHGEKILHPNDHVNMSQSSNDTFPTAMHIAVARMVHQNLIPAVDALITSFEKLENKYQSVIKSGRTHLQDATPVTFGQEVSGWKFSLIQDKEMIIRSLDKVYEIALGGTAVGTGINTPDNYSPTVASVIEQLTQLPFVTSPNKFHALTSKDELVWVHGAIKALATDMMKIANDIRWLASGPRCGLGEITIPSNEPGSSIMPGKVNPTQCEAVTMVSVQVMANDLAVGMAASQGNFELNVFMPVMIYNMIQSIELLSDVVHSFNDNCVVGITVNEEKMAENLSKSLMLVTKLNPHIGYENAAKTAKLAYEKNMTLREAVVALDLMTAEAFDQVMRPETMI